MGLITPEAEKQMRKEVAERKRKQEEFNKRNEEEGK